MKKKKVLLTCAHKLPDWCLKYLRGKFDLREEGCAISEDALAENLKDTEGYITGGNEKFTKKVFDRLVKPPWEIFLGKQPSTFHDPEVWEAMKDRIFTTGGGEMAVAHEALRYINEYNPRRLKALHSSGLLRFSPAESYPNYYPGLIIGPGSIGQQVLSGCKEADYCGRRPKEEILGRNFYPLDPELLQLAITGKRFVSLHLELTPETAGILKAEYFRFASPDLLFLNFARDGLMAPEELLKLLEMFPLAWIVWDVFAKEGAALAKLLADGAKNPFDTLLLRILKMFQRFWYTGHTAAESTETFEEYGKGVMRIVEYHLPK